MTNSYLGLFTDIHADMQKRYSMLLCKQQMHVQTCGHLILCSQSKSLAREEGNVLA